MAVLTLADASGMTQQGPLLRLAEDSKELFGLILRHLTLVDVNNLGATCRLLRTVSLSEAALPRLKSAISCNTQALLQENLAAQTICYSKCVTPAQVVVSPCGLKLAWQVQDAIHVKDRRHNQQASARLPSLVESGDMAWSHDSSRICMAYTTQQAQQFWGHILIMTVSSSTLDLILLGPTYEGCWPSTSWAPSACVLAAYPFCRRPKDFSPSFQPNNPAGLEDTDVCLCLIDASGQLTTTVYPFPDYDFSDMEPVWAATSSLLFLESAVNTNIYDLVTQQHHRFEALFGESNIKYVWSPNSWGAPQLLCVEAHFASLVDAVGTVRTSPTALDQVHLSQAVWGQQGVALVDEEGVWLCGLQDRPTGPLLELKHHVQISRVWLHRPSLSPDHMHLRLSQYENRGGSWDWVIRPVIVNTLSGRHALLENSELMRSTHSCTWSRLGQSLMMGFTSNQGSKRSFFKIFNFVF